MRSVLQPSFLQALRQRGRVRVTAWVLPLLLALLLPSLWGTWHRVAHAPSLAVGWLAKPVLASSDAHLPGSEDCRVLDQAACADGLSVAILPAPGCLGCQQAPTLAGGQAASSRMVACYAARAPPPHATA